MKFFTFGGGLVANSPPERPNELITNFEVVDVISN